MTPPDEMRERITPPLDASAREALLRLYAILDRMDADAQLLFTMRYVQRLELTDLAEVFGVSLATIKRRLSRVADRVFTMARRDEALVGYLKSEEPAAQGAE
jgi:RNA polymerase sigma-70 factor (ECF subfamily)